MLDTIFLSIFDGSESISVGDFMVCIAVALLCGALLGFTYAFRGNATKSFIVTLALLPSAVGMVIMLVNGSLGAGIAVAGAFSLIRFRSSPGTAREIVAIFIVMCVGFSVGMGYLGYAVLFTVIMGGILFILNVTGIWEKRAPKEKTLRITIPEDLNYSNAFDDLFREYTVKYQTVSVKTTNLGSMFKLTYNITLRDLSREKQFIDELRCRNGNLEISISDREDKLNEQL